MLGSDMMKGQSHIILALVFALVVAIFSISNIQNVEVNYMFGHFKIPLVIVILGSVMFGALIVFLVGGWKFIKMKSRLKNLEREIHQLQMSSKKESVVDVDEQAVKVREEKESSI